MSSITFKYLLYCPFRSDDLRPAVPSRRVRHPPVNEVGDHPIDPQLDMNTRNIEDELRQLIEERRRDLALRPIDIIDPLCPMHFTGIQVDPERLQDSTNKKKL